MMSFLRRAGTLCISLALLLAAGTPVFAQHPPLNYTNFGVGDNAFPYLHAWGGVDNVQAHFYTSTNSGLYHNGFFYGNATTGSKQFGVAAAVYTNNSLYGVGSYLYGEADTNSTSSVWGANLIGVTYSPSAIAHGVEVDAINNSGSVNPVVDGVYIVNAGSAKTTASLVIATSVAQPAGRPDYGIMLAGPNTTYATTAPATVTGLYIDQIASGEAIRIQADHRIALTNTGDTYIRYNSSTNTIQIVKHNVVVKQW
jgi:hypothetical protein